MTCGSLITGVMAEFLSAASRTSQKLEIELLSDLQFRGEMRDANANGSWTALRSYVAQPINIAMTATVSLIPCARIGTHKLRPDRR